MAAAKGDDVDIFGYYAEPPLVALNLFHLRNGQIVDRREFFWEDQMDFDASQFFSSLLKQQRLSWKPWFQPNQNWPIRRKKTSAKPSRPLMPPRLMRR